MKTLTRTVLCLTVLTLACGTLFAADQRLPEIAIVVASGDIHPNVGNDAGLKTIFSNLGSKTDAYYDAEGYYIAGPNHGSYYAQWVAVAFTPVHAATATQIQIAVEWYGLQNSTKGFELVLAADASGLPGKSLHSWDVKKNVPNFGTCCKLDTATYAKGIKLKKGKQYWVVAKTDSKSTDTVDVWDYTWNEQRGNIASTDPNLGRWVVTADQVLPAFAVQGTIP